MTRRWSSSLIQTLGDYLETVFEKRSYQEVLLVVVPDTSGIGPVSGHTSGGKKWRNRLVKEEVISNQLLLRGVGHFIKGEVLAFLNHL